MAEPVTKSVVVDADPATAFRVWVEEIEIWWPKSHSRSKNLGTRVLIEPRAGGRFYERTPDGAEMELGVVVTYEPPHRLVYQWFPGASAERPTVVSITFAPVDGGTRVDVLHRAGTDLDLWTRNVAGFERAWTDVLSCFERAVP